MIYSPTEKYGILFFFYQIDCFFLFASFCAVETENTFFLVFSVRSVFLQVSKIWIEKGY